MNPSAAQYSEENILYVIVANGAWCPSLKSIVSKTLTDFSSLKYWMLECHRGPVQDHSNSSVIIFHISDGSFEGTFISEKAPEISKWSAFTGWLTHKYHHDPDQVNSQVPLFGIRVQKVEHDGSYNEENEAAHLWETLVSALRCVFSLIAWNVAAQKLDSPCWRTPRFARNVCSCPHTSRFLNSHMRKYLPSFHWSKPLFQK